MRPDTRCGPSRSPTARQRHRSRSITTPTGSIPELTMQTWLVIRLIPEPKPDCWLHPDVQVRPSAIDQLGLLARAAISAGTIVSRLGGRLVTASERQQILA